MKEEGTKLDTGKPRLSLVPKAALYAQARALGYGADKPEYGRDNYKKGLRYTRLCDAAMRHIEEFLEGVKADGDSGLDPLDHALAALSILAWMKEHRPDMDDRSSPLPDTTKQKKCGKKCKCSSKTLDSMLDLKYDSAFDNKFTGV